MTLVASLMLGVLIGLSLGALGGGGSILTVPALVYVLHEPAQAATTGSLVIVGVTALIGALGYTHAGNVRWGAGIVFGVVGVAASYLGTDLNLRVNPDVLLLAFAALMLIAATAMLRRSASAGDVLPNSATELSGPDSPSGQGGSSTLTATKPMTLVRGYRTLTVAVAVKVVSAALAVGFLTGFLGVGGGFVAVPTLVMALDFPMAVAVGTFLLVIALNSAAALAARAGSETFHWSIIVPFTAAAIVGSVAGKEVADRVSGAALSRAFAALLIAVAVYVAIRSGVGLAA